MYGNESGESRSRPMDICWPQATIPDEENRVWEEVRKERKMEHRRRMEMRNDKREKAK